MRTTLLVVMAVALAGCGGTSGTVGQDAASPGDSGHVDATAHADSSTRPDGRVRETGAREAGHADSGHDGGVDAPPAHDARLDVARDAGSEASLPGDAATDAGPHVLRGAYANPDAATSGGGGSEAQVEALEAVVGHLDLQLDYHPFAEAFPTAGEQAALAHARVPVVSLGCGDTMQHLIDGAQDTTLKALADAMKATGKPVVLRWFWEMNLAETANGRTACFDSTYDGKGAQAPNFFDPAHYIGAWQHIHGVVAAEGATNVRMFFCPSGGAASTAAQYYPGDAYVEINGFDVYDRNGGTLGATLAAPYAAAISASSTRPIWVGETGSMGATQATYIDGQTRATLRTMYPKVRAITYFDSVGPAGNWSFTAAGLAGFTAFGP